MKKTRMILLSVLAVAGLSMVSCDKNEKDPGKDNQNQTDPGKDNPGTDDPGTDDPGNDDSKGMTFNAVCSDGTLAWSAGDVIGIFPSDGLAVPFTTSESAIADGKAAFSYEEKLESDVFYAVYPYNEKDLLIENVLSTILPFEHSVSNVASHNISVAKADGGNVDFKNVLGFIRLNVTDADLTEIVIRSKNSKVSLAGKVEITIPDSGDPTVEVLDGIPVVTLVPADGEEFIAPGTYNLPVVPGSLDQGISLRVKTEGFMYVKDVDAQTAQRASAVDLGTAAKAEAGFDKYTEYVINSDASGFDGCYREFGTKSIDTAPNFIWHLGDGDPATYWNMPPGILSGGTGEAYDIEGNKTIRGSYLRLEFHKASGTAPKTDNIYFEYVLAYDPEDMDHTQVLDWAPWTLDVREYGSFNLDGAWKYGTVQHLTVEESALPWTAEYNNRYVSNVVNTPNTERHMDRLILCCTRTRWNDEHELMPKDAVEGVTFKNLVQETPESRWALAELRVWMKPLE